MDLEATGQWQADRHTSRTGVPLSQQHALLLWQGDLDLWLLHMTASSKVLHTMQRGAEHHVEHGVGEECRRHGSLPITLNQQEFSQRPGIWLGDLSIHCDGFS